MKAADLLTAFENQFEPLRKKGLSSVSISPRTVFREMTIIPKIDGDTVVDPSTHKLNAFRPFIFDTRQLPKKFLEYELEIITSYESIPDEFRLEEAEIPFDIYMSEEKILAYAEKTRWIFANN